MTDYQNDEAVSKMILLIEMMYERCKMKIAHLHALSFIDQDDVSSDCSQHQEFHAVLAMIETDLDATLSMIRK